MIRWMSIAIFSLIGATPLWAKLELRNIQPSHGVYGPARTSLDVYPLDEFVIRYQLAGVKTDSEGKATMQVSMRLTNPKGEVVLKSDGKLERVLSLGGDSLSSFAQVVFPEGDKYLPGEYTLNLLIRDTLASETVTLERKLTAKPLSFQILNPRFSHDADGKIPAEAGGIVGQNLYYRIKVIGFDKSKKEIHTSLKVELTDSEGKDIGSKPLIVAGDLTNAAEVEKRTQATFNGSLNLNRVGNFKIKMTVEDRVAKKTLTFETPIRVTAVAP